MDYSVRDSSVRTDPDVFHVFDHKDCAVRIGIVREERLDSQQQTRYIVEVASGGRQIPVSCVLLSRWGGVYNFEEFRVRPWVQKFPANALLPSSAGKYELRSGDVVLVAYMEGQSREGVIIGGLNHPARSEVTTPGNIEYISRFNGLETQIRTDGSYKVEFKGAPVNQTLLEIPPTGTPIPDPVFDPLIAGSYYGFDADGSYVVSDGKQFIKIIKDEVTGGNMVIESGNNRIDFGGNLVQGSMGLTTDNFAVAASMNASIKATVAVKVESLQASIKATQMAIGSDTFELFQGLSDLIDAIGTIVVTSPVGTCTPISAAPTWVAQVIPIKIKISTMITSLASADDVDAVDEGDTSLGTDVGS